MKRILALAAIAAFSLLAIQPNPASAQNRPRRRTRHTRPRPAPQPSDGSQAAATGCDATLWDHVYNPTRLTKTTECVTVTGTIVDATAKQKMHRPDGLRHEPDGDTHGWLKLDAQFQNLLNAGNKSNEAGNMVFEVVCKFPVTQPDAVAACNGYTSPIDIPAVGSHVAITGTLVQDTNHAKWMEIHPVSKIVVQ